MYQYTYLYLHIYICLKNVYVYILLYIYITTLYIYIYLCILLYLTIYLCVYFLFIYCLSILESVLESITTASIHSQTTGFATTVEGHAILNEHLWFCKWKTTSQGEPARAEASLGLDQGCKLHGAVLAGSPCSDAF